MALLGGRGGDVSPDPRLVRARNRANATRQRVLQPEGGGGDFVAPHGGYAQAPTRAPQRGYVNTNQAAPGGGLGLSDVLSGPGNAVRKAIGPTGMNIIKQLGPIATPMGGAYQASRLIPGAFDKVSEAYGDVATDPYTYLGGYGGAATRSVKGLGFLEKILSRTPKSVSAATLDRGPAVPDIASLLTSDIDPSMFPMKGRPGFPGNPLAPNRRMKLEDMVQGADMGPPGLMGAMNEQADELPNMFAQQIPGRPNRLAPDQDINEIELAMANDDPSVIEEMMQGGFGTPQMGGQTEPGDLSRILMEELGGTKPRQTRWGEQSLQGAAPFGLVGAGGGGYGWQQQQQQQMNPALQRRIRQRIPMLAQNWR